MINRRTPSGNPKESGKSDTKAGDPRRWAEAAAAARPRRKGEARARSEDSRRLLDKLIN